MSTSPASDYDEALVLDWRSRLHADDLNQILKAQIAGEASRKPFSLEGRYRRADGEMRWLKSFSQPRLGPGGEFIGFIGIAFDVTDAKEAEVKLTGLNELLADRVQEALSERDDGPGRPDPVAEAGGHRPADRRRRPRLQQPADRDHRRAGRAGAQSRRRQAARPHAGAAQSAARRGEKLTQHLLAFARRQPLNPRSAGSTR
jgi:hypothetical protein